MTKTELNFDVNKLYTRFITMWKWIPHRSASHFLC